MNEIILEKELIKIILKDSEKRVINERRINELNKIRTRPSLWREGDWEMEYCGDINRKVDKMIDFD